MTNTHDRHHHGNLKEALVEAALEAARNGTIETMSLRQTSRDLGVSPGAIYRHFPDKEALLRSLAQRGFDMLAEEFDSVMPFESKVQNAKQARMRFFRLATCYVRFAREHYGLWRLMFGPYGLVPDKVPKKRPNTYEWLGKSLDELADAKLIVTRSSETQFFAWSAIHGLSDLQASPAIDGTATSDEMVRAQCDLIIRAMAPSRAN